MAKNQPPRQSHKISQGYHQQDCCSPQNDQNEKGDGLPNQSQPDLVTAKKSEKKLPKKNKRKGQ